MADCVNEKCVLNKDGLCQNPKIAKDCEKRVLSGQVEIVFPTGIICLTSDSIYKAGVPVALKKLSIPTEAHEPELCHKILFRPECYSTTKDCARCFVKKWSDEE